MWRHLEHRYLSLACLAFIAALGMTSCGKNNEPGTTPPGTTQEDMTGGGGDMAGGSDMGEVEDLSSPADMPAPQDMSSPQDMSAPGDMDPADMPDPRDMPADMTDMSGPSCEDECSQGELLCEGDGAYKICGQYDQDPCLESSPPISCAMGHVCDSGRCVTECRDECNLGATICVDEQTVQVCGNFDQDACLESGADVTCPAGERCEQGDCVPTGQACADECQMMGEFVCFGDATRECGQHDSDTCLDLGPPIACGQGDVCQAGQCVAGCTDECPAQGTTECVGGAVRTCGNLDQDSCLEWSAPSQCGADEACSEGACVDQCADECSAAGTAVCSPDGLGVSFCGQYDPDTCLDRSSPIPCPDGFGCQNGLCVATCTNDCTTGSTRCGADGSSLETCGDFDNDPCLEFGGAVSCPGGAACEQNACDVPCSDECTTQDRTECVGDSTRTCGQFDIDACLEWSTTQPCEAWETCQTGACELGATPFDMVLNEIVYDSVGSDSGANNTLFVELWGMPNASLDGWSVVAIDGNNGTETDRISLDGEVVGADGYFVIAHPQGDPMVLAAADLTTSDVDFQNGPDNVQVQWRGRVVDALGYGSFSANQTFVGEGAPAPSAPAGNSLTRDSAHTDTNDNSADFSVAMIPTPRGAIVGCVDECNMAGSSQCSGDQIQTCGDYDTDNCLELSAPMACPMGETCQGNACAPPCMDECSAQGDTECLGAQIITCGNYDADSCLEWSPASSCPNNQTCFVDQCQSPDAPEVVMITPQGTTQTTQGNTHRILVDATAAPNRTISKVEFFANGNLVGSTLVPPHEVDYTIPAATPTNTLIAIQAIATDSLNETGVSTYAYLNVQNDLPVADFTATITNTTTVTVDASSSSDTETDSAALEVCWDWDDDGNCDTPYSTDKIASHDYGVSGTYTIRAKVRDPQGQISEVTRQVSFMDIQYLGGVDVATTLWYGTIIVTGDLRVPAGETLTIAPGTDILFVHADVESPAGVGDYGLLIEGELIVNGTANEPVVFSGQDMAAKVPGGWDSIKITGNTPSTITHAIIEYAQVGLDISNATTVNDVTVRQTGSDCITLNNADNAAITDTTVTDCGQDGVRAINGSTGVTITGLDAQNNGRDGVSLYNNSNVELLASTMASNAQDGVEINDSTLDMTDSLIEDNDGIGMHFLGAASGESSRNQIRSNGKEGLGLFTTLDGTPNPILNLNNIYSNAVAGSSSVTNDDPSATLSASFTCCNSTGTTSGKWTVPANKTLRRAYVSFNEAANSSSIDGYLLNGDTNAILRSFETDFNGWVYIPEGVTSLRVRVKDSGYSYSADTITVTQVEYTSEDGAHDIVSALDSGTVNLRHNYLGVFPDVLSRISMQRTTELDLQGFVGVLFDPMTWDRGPYVGGEELATTTWSGTIYVTGTLDILAGQILDVAAGTRIEFIAHDQDGDGDGDFSIDARGQMNLNGAAGNEIIIAPHTSVAGDSYQSIELRGSGADASTWNDVDISGGRIAITLAGSSNLTRVTITGGGLDGVYVTSGQGSILDDLTVNMAARDCIRIQGNTDVTLQSPSLRDCGENGASILGGSNAQILDGTIRDNVRDGIYVSDSSPTLDYNILTYNGRHGIRYEGSSSGSAEHNVIKFNDDVGVRVQEEGGASPTPAVQYSNIYGNAVMGVATIAFEDPSATLDASFTCCNSTGTTSGKWTVPANKTMRRAYVSFNEAANSSSIDGYLLNGDTNAILRSFETDFNGWVTVPEGVTSLRVRVKDSGYSYSADTITVTQVEVEEHDPMASYEMYVSTDAGTTLAKFNYWTPSIGDVPNRIFETRPNSVDYTGFTGIEYSDAGPRP